MGIFSRFPYTDFHRLNADWILEKVKEMLGLTQQAAETVEGYETRLSTVETAAAGAVRFDAAQDLSSAQQTQGRSNINAASQTDLIDYVEALQDLIDMISSQVRNCVRFDLAQSLTGTQQAQARSNIGAADAIDVEQVIRDLQTLATYAVMVNAAQTFTDAQKAQARANIGAAAEGTVPVPTGAVLYNQAQSLTTGQKTQARSNIGALQADDPTVENLYIATNNQDIQIYSDDPATGPVLALEGMNQDSSGLDVRISGLAAPISGNDAVNKTYADSIRGSWLDTISGADVIIQPDRVGAVPNSFYNLTNADLNSLEIVPGSGAAANREYTIRFTGGSDTTLTTPLTILGLDDLVPETGVIYEINIAGDLAVWHSWEVGA